jgi:hypothetical protein
MPAARSTPAPRLLTAFFTNAACRNPNSGVTGVLCYGGGIFLQAIEGGRMVISELYNQIQRDKRHKEVVLLHYEEISERRFGGWTMGEVNMNRINASILLKYAEKPELDPYSVSGKVSLALAGGTDGHRFHHRPGLSPPAVAAPAWVVGCDFSSAPTPKKVLFCHWHAVWRLCGSRICVTARRWPNSRHGSPSQAPGLGCI